jgi:hypothetical protein
MIPGWQVRVPPSTLQGQSDDWAETEKITERQKIPILNKIIFVSVDKQITNVEIEFLAQVFKANLIISK